MGSYLLNALISQQLVAEHKKREFAVLVSLLRHQKDKVEEEEELV